MARSSKYVKFSFPISAYQPDALQQGYSEKELRKEYTRLRDIAQKRIKRMGESEFRESQTYKYNVNRFSKLADIGSKSELTHLLGDLARFLTASRGSIAGMKEERQRSIDTWHEKGATFVNAGNYNDWIDFLVFVKDFVGFNYWEKAADMYQQAKKEGISTQEIMNNFEAYQSRMGRAGTLTEGWDE